MSTSSQTKRNLQAVRKRLEKSPWLGDPSKHDICLLCGNDFYDCEKHSRKDVHDIAVAIRILDLIGE